MLNISNAFKTDLVVTYSYQLGSSSATSMESTWIYIHLTYDVTVIPSRLPEVNVGSRVTHWFDLSVRMAACLCPHPAGVSHTLLGCPRALHHGLAPFCGRAGVI